MHTLRCIFAEWLIVRARLLHTRLGMWLVLLSAAFIWAGPPGHLRPLAARTGLLGGVLCVAFAAGARADRIALRIALGHPTSPLSIAAGRWVGATAAAALAVTAVTLATGLRDGTAPGFVLVCWFVGLVAAGAAAAVTLPVVLAGGNTLAAVFIAFAALTDLAVFLAPSFICRRRRGGRRRGDRRGTPRPDPMTDALLSFDGVTRSPLGDVRLEVRAGELVGLVGAAGAGKTTLLRLAAGALTPERGRVTVAGQPAASTAARRLAGFAPATPVFPPGLTVRDLLDYYARFHGPAERGSGLVAAALEVADLGNFAGRRPATLPYGVLRRIALAQAVLGGRRLLLLDETLEGSDPALRRGLGERLGRLVWNGAAVVLASQDLATVERLADRIVVLHAGRVARDAPAAVLLRDRVLEVVLDAPPSAAPAGFRLAPFGIEADLRDGTVESALALCRAHRLVVRATRVRCKSLEDVVVETGRGS